MIDITTLQGKLEWIASRDYDPRKSQIRFHNVLKDPYEFISENVFPFYLKQNQTVYYQDLANIILGYINVPKEHDIFHHINSYYDLIESMYNDIVKQDKWGFIL